MGTVFGVEVKEHAHPAQHDDYRYCWGHFYVNLRSENKDWVETVAAEDFERQLRGKRNVWFRSAPRVTEEKCFEGKKTEYCAFVRGLCW